MMLSSRRRPTGAPENQHDKCQGKETTEDLDLNSPWGSEKALAKS